MLRTFFSPSFVFKSRSLIIAFDIDLLARTAYSMVQSNILTPPGIRERDTLVQLYFAVIVGLPREKLVPADKSDWPVDEVKLEMPITVSPSPHTLF